MKANVIIIETNPQMPITLFIMPCHHATPQSTGQEKPDHTKRQNDPRPHNSNSKPLLNVFPISIFRQHKTSSGFNALNNSISNRPFGANNRHAIVSMAMTLNTVAIYDSIRSSMKIPNELKSLTQLALYNNRG